MLGLHRGEELPVQPLGLRRVIELGEDGRQLDEQLVPHLGRVLQLPPDAIRPGVHPIVPVMLGEATLATKLADELLGEGIYVIGFFFPVVPKGQARIRVQLSAAHTPEQIDRALAAFAKVGKKLGVVK